MSVFSENSFEVNDKNLDWLMSKIDVPTVLERLDVRFVNRIKSDEVWGYCPDHHLFTQRYPSHPKWSINTKTGKTNCFTEKRGSNIVWIVTRLKEMSVNEAVEWLLGGSLDAFDTRLSRLKKMLNGLVPKREIDTNTNLEEFERQLKSAELGNKSICFLAKNNVSAEIARRFNCVEFDSGYYRDRLVFPIYGNERDLRGFVATDVLGVDEWLKRNPVTIDRESRLKRKTVADDYRKVLYPKNFNLRQYLFGTEFFSGETAILVEGIRDVLKLHQEGFKGALGIGGSGVSEEQVTVLSGLPGLKKIIFMLDGDRAGREGAERAARRCKYFLKDVFVTILDEGVDPKDLSRAEIMYYLKNKTHRVLDE